MSKQPAEAVFVFTDNSLFGLAGPIIARALEARVPRVGSLCGTFAQAGGLYAYGNVTRWKRFTVSRDC